MTFAPMRPVQQSILFDEDEQPIGTAENPLNVVAAPPAPPPATTPVQIANDTPLSTVGTTTTSYLIPNGQTFTLQQIEAGGQGDPTESGTCVEVFYFDGLLEHVVTRTYTTGFTIPLSPNMSKARDGTSMVGDGLRKAIRLRRRRLSGGAQEVDAVARGYVS